VSAKDVDNDVLTRWCESTICGCLGCANGSARTAIQFSSKAEWEDFLAWRFAGNPEHTDIPSFHADMVSKPVNEFVMDFPDGTRLIKTTNIEDLCKLKKRNKS